MSDSELGYDQHRRSGQPYTGHHPVPTIESYEKELQSRSDNNAASQVRWTDDMEKHENQHNLESRLHRQGGGIILAGALNSGYSDHDSGRNNSTAGHPISQSPVSKKNTQGGGYWKNQAEYTPAECSIPEEEPGKQEEPPEPISIVDATKNQPKSDHEPPNASGRKPVGKAMGSNTQHRVVTDPITHLPITIHDNNSEELKEVPFSVSKPSKDADATDAGSKRNQGKHYFLQALVDKEILEEVTDESIRRREVRLPLEVGLAVSGSVFVWGISSMYGKSYSFVALFARLASTVALATTVGLGVAWWIKTSMRGTQKPVKSEDDDQHTNDSRIEFKAETTLWLNNTIAAIWPLINPDLFVSLCDTLEDVMQVSLQNATRLPVEGVSVSDWGQGSDPPTILGVRWLDQGLAGEEKDGMGAEEGEYVNLELALSYRARKSGKGLKIKLRNIHVFVEFWWRGGFRLPIWTEIHSFISTARIRLQLSPDPPFFSVCTLTLLGQPKVSISCVPLARRFPNIMDIPIISSFVQKSIDAAVAQYVAPKSLTLDLKEMIMGDDVKKDTVAKGVLIVKVGSARNFKNGDGTKGWLSGANMVNKVKNSMGKKEEGDCEGETGGGDTYVTVGWSKFGKPVFKSRIITNCHTPTWEETTAVLIGPDELNAGERLCLQLWDSDRLTADDLLGTVEVDLQELMHNPETAGKINSRVDRLMDLCTHKNMPGELSWSVGYFGKTAPTEEELGMKAHKLKNNPVDDRARKNEILKRAREFRQGIKKDSEAKLREVPRDSPLLYKELEQQKTQDVKEATDTLITSSAPNREFPSGILSVQIHQGVGFEIEKTRNPDRKMIRSEENFTRASDDEENEEGDDLPSPYCIVVLNHINVYKTRVKWKTSKPFFNAAMERFVRDWQNTEVIVAVKDARMHENDALMGVVVLPLKDILKDSSNVNGVFPLCGGIGYGRLRVSLLFRGVEAKLPRNMLGWSIGTIQIQPEVRCRGELAGGISTSKLVFRTSYGKGHMYPESQDSSSPEVSIWKTKRERNLHLAVKHRYSSYMIIEFQKSHSIDILDQHVIKAFSILWLKDIPDAHDQDTAPECLNLPIWSLLDKSKGDTKDILALARKNVQEEYGHKLGYLEIQLEITPGVGRYHSKLARRDTNLREVMEVLDSAGEAKEVNQDNEGGGYGSDLSSSSSSSESEGEVDGRADPKGRPSENQLRSDGDRGPIKDLKEYKMNKYHLHRHHRGLMQWKGVRTLKWAKDEVKHKGQHMMEKVERKLKHDGGDGDWYGNDDGEGGVETEV